MSVKLELKVNVVTVVLLAVVAFLLFKWGNLRDEITQWTNNYEVMQDSLTTEISKLDGAIIYKDGIIGMQQKELKDALKSDSIQRELVKHYKKVASAVKIETVIQVDSIPVPYPVYVDNDTMLNVVRECYEVALEFKENTLSITDFKMYNRQDIILGDQRKGLWKTEQAIEVRNSNPCITTTGIQTYQVVVPIKWHQKWWITVPAGFAAGYLTGKIQ
jgi:hypothetical protein